MHLMMATLYHFSIWFMAIDVHRVLGWQDVKSFQAYLMKLLLQLELLQAPSRYELFCPTFCQSEWCRHGAWTHTQKHLQVCLAWYPAAVGITHLRGSLPCLWAASLPQRAWQCSQGAWRRSSQPWTMGDHKTWSVGCSWWDFWPLACPRQLVF